MVNVSPGECEDVIVKFDSGMVFATGVVHDTVMLELHVKKLIEDGHIITLTVPTITVKEQVAEFELESVKT